MSKQKRMSNFAFRGLSLWITLRGLSRKPLQTLEALGLKKGQNIIDYGAGPGAFTIPAAQLVGPGEVIAVDIHPLAKKIIERKAKNKGLSNVNVILANINTGLTEQTIDIVFLFDVVHQIKEKSRLFKELHRVLKSGGILFVRPDHISKEELNFLMKSDGLFIYKQDHGEIIEYKKLG